MPRIGRRGAATLAWMLACATGCSLTGLDRFELPTCTSSAQCEVLNQRRGIAAGACERFQCSPSDHVCRIGPRDGDGDGDPAPECGGHDCDDADGRRAGAGPAAHETCDGVDNDCNLVIDDGVLSPSGSGELITSLPMTAASRLGVTLDGTTGLTTSDGGRSALGVFAGSHVVRAPVALQYARQLNEDSLSDPTLVPMQCPPDVHTCSFDEVATAAWDSTSSRWLVASVNTIGCSFGQLRIGHMGESDGTVVLRGPIVRSTIATGIDVDATTQCTGASRASGIEGVTRPAVATLPANGPRLPQGLVAWIGRGAVTNACSAPAAPIEALGVWLETTPPPDTTVAWVSASGAGSTQTLGRTAGDSPPAIASLPDLGGYLVAYGSDTGDVTLQFLSLPADPPPIDYMRTDAAYATTVRPTVPLTVSSSFVVARATTGRADHVVVSVGSRFADGVDLGVAWQDGCPTGAIQYARVRFAPTHPDQSRVLDTVTLATVAGSMPSIAFAGTGFVVPGFSRNGVTATETDTGGWAVGWVASDAARSRYAVRRLLELDGEVLDEPPTAITTAGSGSIDAIDGALYAGPAAMPGLIRYVVRDAAGAAWLGGDLSCPAL